MNFRRVSFWVVMVSGLTATMLLPAQERIQVDADAEVNPWTHLDVNNDPDSFQFAIVTDRTGGHRPGVFMDGVRKLNLLQPEFVVSVGDLIEGYTQDIEKLNLQWNEFDSFVKQLDMPFFYIPGNHDITNQTMMDLYEKRYGKKWYHFVYKDVLFLLLDSEDPPSSQMSKEQTDYARKVLADNPNVRWTLVFIHKPLWVYGDVEKNGWKPVEDALQGRKHSVFAGHTHHYKKYEKQDSEYIVLATMGGGSQMRGANFGEFDHFMWVTMNDDGPQFANLMLDGIWDTNVYTEKRADLIRPLVSGAAVTTSGIVVDGAEFSEAETMLRLKNDANIPMEVTVSIPGTEHVTPSVRRVNKTVPPNSVEQMKITLKADSPVSSAGLAPISARWSVSYTVEGEIQPIEVRGTHRIIVDSRYKISKASRPVTVDGDLGEWSSMTVISNEPGQVHTDFDAWQSGGDASTDIGVSYGSEFLYIAVDARDDEHRTDRRMDYMRQDSLLVRIDGRPEAQRATRGEDFKDILFVAMLPGKGDAGVFDLDKLPAGTKVATRKTGAGYQAEIAIPLSYLGEKQGGNWDSVRINVGQNDIDGDGRALVWWRPDWKSPANYAGSGTFVKQ